MKKKASDIVEALYRDGYLKLQYKGAERIIESLLDGTYMMVKVECKECLSSTRVVVTCESSGGSFYDEDRGCEDCSERGFILQRVPAPGKS